MLISIKGALKKLSFFAADDKQPRSLVLSDITRCFESRTSLPQRNIHAGVQAVGSLLLQFSEERTSELWLEQL